MFKTKNLPLPKLFRNTEEDGKIKDVGIKKLLFKYHQGKSVNSIILVSAISLK
jgi:hypothetical protein